MVPSFFVCVYEWPRTSSGTSGTYPEAPFRDHCPNKQARDHGGRDHRREGHDEDLRQLLEEDAHVDAEARRLEEQRGEEDDEHHVRVDLLERDHVRQQVAPRHVRVCAQGICAFPAASQALRQAS